VEEDVPGPKEEEPGEEGDGGEKADEKGPETGAQLGGSFPEKRTVVHFEDPPSKEKGG